MREGRFSIQNLFQPPEVTIRLQTWRESVLRIFTFLIPIAATVLMAFNIRRFIDNEMWSPFVFTVLSYVIVLVSTIFRTRLPYSFRVSGIILVTYGLGPLAYSLWGLVGDGREWMIFFVLFTTLMAGMRAGIAASIVAVITHYSFGYMFANDILMAQNPEMLASVYGAEGWISTGVTLLVIILTLYISVGMAVRQLDQSLEQLEQSLATERELSQSLSTGHEELESRSIDLERRVGQIRLAAEISSSLGSFLEPQELLQYVVDRVQSGFSLYYAGVFLIGERKRYAHLVAGTGEAGKAMLAEGHRLTVGGSSMVGWTTANRKPRIALDVGKEAIRFRNPHLPLTRSELALPMAIGDDVRGALTVQSTMPEAFDQDDIAVLQSIADSLTIALQNAELFKQFEESLKEIQFLNRRYLGEAWQDLSDEQEDFIVVHETLDLAGELADTSKIDIPLTLRDDQVIGQITLEAERDDWSPEELEFIEAVSNQAALALESARLLDETQRQVEREQTLNVLTQKFSQTLDFDTLVQSVVRELGQLPRVTTAAIHLSTGGDKPDTLKLLDNESTDA